MAGSGSIDRFSSHLVGAPGAAGGRGTVGSVLPIARCSQYPCFGRITSRQVDGEIDLGVEAVSLPRVPFRVSGLWYQANYPLCFSGDGDSFVMTTGPRRRLADRHDPQCLRGACRNRPARKSHPGRDFAIAR